MSASARSLSSRLGPLFGDAIGHADFEALSGQLHAGKPGDVLLAFEVPDRVQPWQRAIPMEGGRRMVKPQETREYQARLAHHALKAFGSAPPLTGPIEVRVEVDVAVPPSWSKKKTAQALLGQMDHTITADTDNYLKQVKDALNALIWLDDKQVVRDLVDKAYCEKDAVRVILLRARDSYSRRAFLLCPGEQTTKSKAGT